MSTHSKVDPTTLGWVKNEIDEALKQARLALESFTENTADKTRLRFCLTHLHQVVGTLLMVELDGAARLAREIEALAEAILEDKADTGAATLDALTRGIITLPDYLARLMAGAPDMPLQNFTLLNDLRAAHSVPPIKELELFSPDLTVHPPEGDGAGRLNDADFAALARDLRPRYQSFLLEWLRNSGQTAPLREIGGILEQLQQAAPGGFPEQLFWVAGGFTEALAANGLEAGAEQKKHFARLDQHIKKFIDGAERTQLRKSGEELMRGMLLELGQSHAGGERATQIKRAFSLDALLGRDANRFDLPTPDVLKSVAEALGKEVESAQDLLSTYFDPASRDPRQLEQLLDQLHKMGGILDMLGAAALKHLVDELVACAEAVRDGHVAVPDSASMPMAEALLLIENSAHDFQHSATAWRARLEGVIRSLHALRSSDAPDTGGIEVSEAELSDAEFLQLSQVVGEEISINLAKVEEALEAFAADSSKLKVLDPVPGLLNQILGAFQILGQERAGDLVQETRTHIEAITEGALVADAALLDGLAVCVGTVGAYVEGLRGGRTHLETLIESAHRELQAALRRQHGATDPALLLETIGASLNAWLEHNEPAAHAAMQADLDVIGQLAREQGQDKIVRLVEEMNRLASILEGDPAARTPETVTTLQQSQQALATLVQRQLQAAPPVARPVSAAAPADSAGRDVSTAAGERARTAAAQAEDADPEIMQIFIEDATDVFRNIRKEMPAFRANPENNNALLEMRRGYHTIKGSGRMVGAGEIAELAWSVENMLNKLRDGKIKFTGDIVQVLDQAEAVIPVLIGDLQKGGGPSVDVTALRASADAIARGQSPGERSVPAPVEPVRPAAAVADAPVAEAQDTELPSLDPTLLEIFANEASGHLATLRQETEALRASGAALVSDALFRATHTLLGNARSLSIAMMSDACLEVEKLLHTLRSQNLPIEAPQLELVETLESTVSELVAALQRGEQRAGDLRARFALLAHDAHAVNTGLQQGTESAPSAPSPGYGDGTVRQAPPVAPPRSDPAPAATTRQAPPPPIPAESSPVPMSAASDSVVTEQLDAELLEIFLEEAVDILGTIDESLSRWRTNEQDRNALHELKRALHTLKGGARMAGAMTMGTLAHNTESLLRQVEEGKLDARGPVRDILHEAHDKLVSMLDCLRANAPVPGAQNLNSRLLAWISGETPAIPGAASAPSRTAPANAIARGADAETYPGDDVVASFNEDTSAEGVSSRAEPDSEIADAAHRMTGRASEASLDSDLAHDPRPGPAGDERREGEAVAAAPVWPEPMERRGQIRVNTGLLNQLVNFAGEVSISRSRMEQQIYGFRDNMAELTRNVTRFRDQLRELEIQSESQILFRTDTVVDAGTGADFDPLEFDRFSRLQQLSRQLAESLHDLSTIQGSLGNFVGEAEAVLQQQARLNTDLQEGLMRTRMVGFGTQAGRLRHIVRTTAREVGKRVELDLLGAEVELDRTVLDRMIGPFEHMIRNSIDHGVESADVRVRAGKPAEGRITIAVAQEGAEIIIKFSDDGAGLNLTAIRAKAIERGVLAADANVTDDELIQYILQSGFSTASKVTHLSGRGVGMDVVHSEVKQLGGAMSVSTERGHGTSFVIRLPLTLSITQALMLYVGDQQFAMPLSSVANIVEFPVERLNEISVGKNPLLKHEDQIYPYMHLGQRFGLVSAPRNTKKVPVLLMRTGTRIVAMQVDGLGGTREIVIKPLGAQLTEIKGLSGATILGDGRVILILDAPGLWVRDDALHVEHRVSARPRAEVRERPIIMVVDDSLTVRKITGKHLQKHGMEVMTAKDGLDAVEQLRDRLPDLMLVDIEMPRMDGYELTTRVRGDARLKHIPIIMITSRAGAKHKQRALDLGVDFYMSKPYQEDELFNNIDALLKQGHSG